VASVVAALVLGVVSVSTGVTGAFWSGRGTAAGGQVTTGELHLDLAQSVRLKPEENVGWGTMAVSALHPRATTAATLRVANNSRGDGLPLAYTVQGEVVSVTGGTGTTPVTDTGLEVVLRAGGTLVGTAGTLGATCTGGTALTPTSWPDTTAATARTNRLVVGETRTLTTAARRVEEAAADVLCVQVTMGNNTPARIQGVTTTFRLVLSATGLPR